MSNSGSQIDFNKISRLLLEQNERLPVALVDLNAFDRNLKRAAEIVQKKSPSCTVRVATKSIRVPELIARALAYGAPFKGLMAYSAEEASFLVSHGFDDILIAYPTVQTSDLDLLLELHKKGHLIRLIVDSLDHFKILDRHFAHTQIPFPIVIEVDGSLRFFGGRIVLGSRRSAIHHLDDLKKLLFELRVFKHLQLDGVMLYESQIAGIGDSNPVNFWINPLIRMMKNVSRQKIYRFRKIISDYFKSQSLPLTLFNGGGTGSLFSTTQEPWITEVTVGSGFLDSHLFDHYDHLPFEPACFFALQGVRHPAPDWLTCSGGGYTASGKPGWDKAPLVVYPSPASLNGDEGGGEVQTPVRLSQNLKLGDPVFFRHAKAGELAERFREYLLISHGQIEKRTKTYRGFGQCFF